MLHLVGAYATSPCQQGWDEAAEAAFYDGILAIPGVAGLEIPFAGGTLHPHDEAWLLARLPEGSCHVVTCLPGTMQQLAGTPAFGLASDDPAGREAALALARQAHAAVRRLNERLGRPAVMAVELHSAPARGGAGVRSSAGALAASLAALAALDWQGADLVIEHCDAFTPAHPPAKGFLALDEELAAIACAAASGGTRLAMSVNWARSVLETRQADTGLAHVTRLAGLDLLAGLVFSGCSDRADQPYGAWQDNHMPHDGAAPGSLMTAAAIATCLAAGRPRFVGVKVGAQPADMQVAERIRINHAVVSTVRQAGRAAGGAS